MILVVGGEHRSSARIAGLLEGLELDRATSVAEARERLEVTEPAALVIGGPAAGEAAALVADVRAGRLGQRWLGVLAVTGDRAGASGVDTTVRPSADAPTLVAAIERTAILGRYRGAIQTFFDACQGAPGAAPGGPSVREARMEADTWLEAIQELEGRFPLDRLLDGG